MVFTGVVLMLKPPVNQHKCSNCGYVENIEGITYPYTIAINEDWYR